MKKLFSLILALALLAGCAAPTEELYTPEPSPSAAAEPTAAASATPEPSPEPTPQPELSFGFGEIAASYSPYDRPRFTVDCYGDTSLLRAKYLPGSENAVPGTLMFSFEAYEPIALTAAHYEGGMLAGEPADYDLGFIERMENGEWTRFCSLKRTAPEADALRPYAVVDGEFSESFVFRVYDEDEGRFVSYAPGSYRITLSFRKSLDDDGYNYTTSESLYSIQILFFIPEAGDAAFDLVSVGFTDSFETDKTYGVAPFVRRNGDTTFFFDHARTRLEVLADGEWVDALPREGQTSAVENLMSEDSPDRYANETSGFRASVYVADRSAAHRIVYEYCENADGSGRCGELVIPLSFSPPGEPGELTIEQMMEIGRLEGPATSANSSIHSAGLGDHPSFGGCFITDDYHLGVRIKNNDPELRAAILDCVDDSDVVQFVETNASYEDLLAQQDALQDIFWGEEGMTREEMSEMGIEYTGSGIRVTASAVSVDLFVRSKAAFDRFIERFGDKLGENVYFEIRYGADLAEIAADPYTTAPPPPEEVDDWGISLVASNVTRTSATVTFHREAGILDGTDRNPITGAAWSMDVWDGEQWIDIPMSQTVWFMIGSFLGSFDINLEHEFGVLPNGYYRICKSASTAAPNYENRNYYAQFTIDDDTPAALAGE